PGDGGPSPELHSTKSDAKRKQNERQTDSFEKQDTAQGPNRPTSDGDNMHTEKTGMEGWSKEVVISYPPSNNSGTIAKAAKKAKSTKKAPSQSATPQDDPSERCPGAKTEVFTSNDGSGLEISRTTFSKAALSKLSKLAFLIPSMVNKSDQVLVTVTGATPTAGPKSSRSCVLYGSIMDKEDGRLKTLFANTKARAIKLYNEQDSVGLIEGSVEKKVICEANRVLAFPKNVGRTADHKDGFSELKSDNTDRILMTLNPQCSPTQVNTHC
ncbi:hypothetical protein TrRE_jg8059, partial [Triparma retinervis]